MISEQQLQSDLITLLHRLPKDLQLKRIVGFLKKYEKEGNIELSSYGYIMHVLEHRGIQAFWSNVLCSEKTVRAYYEEAVDIRDNMPGLLVNANEYFTRVMSTVPDRDMALSYVVGMTFPYVLWLLLEGSEQHLLAVQYLQEAEELAKKYPSAFDKLPETYKKAGRRLVSNGDDKL